MHLFVCKALFTKRTQIPDNNADFHASQQQYVQYSVSIWILLRTASLFPRSKPPPCYRIFFLYAPVRYYWSLPPLKERMPYAHVDREAVLRGTPKHVSNSRYPTNPTYSSGTLQVRALNRGGSRLDLGFTDRPQLLPKTTSRVS